MKNSAFCRLFLLGFILSFSSSVFAQTATVNLKGKWLVESFETEKNTSASNKAKQDLQGLYLFFDSTELVISKATNNGDSVLKKGPYTFSGKSIVLGNDSADVVQLSETNCTIKIPGQGVLSLRKIQ